MFKLFKLMLTIGLLLMATTGYCVVPHLINYQGKLTDTNNAPLEGSHNLTFRIYNAETAGTLLWQETQSVTIQKGIFNVLLGAVTNLNIPFDVPYFLEIVVGGEVMSPRQRIASAGYAMRAEKADLATQTDNASNADTVDNQHANSFIQTGMSAGGHLSGTFSNLILNDGVVSQSKLKTDIGEVSATGRTLCVLPGGQYGFYPQIKSSVDGAVNTHVYMCGMVGSSTNLGTTYLTRIYFGADSGQTLYARQRYVTASGLDPWLFLNYDKKQNKILSVWYSPDHPSYGQEIDEKQLPHPFIDYLDYKNPASSKKIPKNIEIILVELTQTKDLEKECYVNEQKEVVKNGEKKIITNKKLVKGLTEIVNQEYDVDINQMYSYVPRDISDANGNHWNVETVPEYIKIRKLIKKVN